MKASTNIVLFLATVSLVSNYLEFPLGSGAIAKISALNNGMTHALIEQVKAFIPYVFYGKDLSWAILLIALYILGAILASLLFDLEHIKNETVFEYKRKRSNLVQESVIEVDGKTIDFSAETPKDRNQLLQEFIALKAKLDAMGQNYSFLAIDVVDSTGMKSAEDKHLTIYDFDRYNEIASACLFDNGVLKYATTPDGIMACFKSVDQAVRAATSLIENLKVFNSTEKKIKRDFEVRCGINAGFVFIDDMPMEQITDQVIDIAGHMQKHAKPNTIYLAGSAFEHLKNTKGFIETSEIIDGQKVYSWKL